MGESNISFQSVGTFSLKTESALIKCIRSLVKQELREIGDITFVFCDDNYLHKINLEFLDHDTYTDIITFDYSVGNEIVSEIYISVDRVAENAKKFSQTFENEIHRVMIHDVLYLCGYKDKLAKTNKLCEIKKTITYLC